MTQAESGRRIIALHLFESKGVGLGDNARGLFALLSGASATSGGKLAQRSRAFIARLPRLFIGVRGVIGEARAWIRG